MSIEPEAVNSQVAEALAAVERALTVTATRHSCAIALQDAVDHLRDIELLATAATARALGPMANEDRTKESEKVLQEARNSVKAALENMFEIVTRLGPWLASEPEEAPDASPEETP